MTLSEWRTVRRLSLRAAERELGISHVHLAKLEAAKVSPTLSTVDQIARKTQGAVTRLDWPEQRSALPLVPEPIDMGVAEACCFCHALTRFWTDLPDRTPGQQVACCPDCAGIFDADVVPSKNEWMDYWRERNHAADRMMVAP